MKRRLLAGRMSILYAVALLFLASPATAQKVDIIADVVYGHKDGMALTFDVLKPADANGAAVMYMVSGGWVSAWSDPERMVTRFSGLLDHGITLFIVRHGSSPRYFVPEAVADVRRAARFIQQNAALWGVDPDRLGAHGGSAGGHLSLMLGIGTDTGDPEASEPFMREPVRLASVVAYYPPVDLRTWARGRMPDAPADQRFPALNFDRDLAAGISPILFVSPDDPPTLLIHGTADATVPLDHSIRIHNAFEQVGVETDLIIIDGAGHGFTGEDAVRANAAMVDWFVRTLTPD
ncbi:MAG: alpha/beta hydrolase [Gemmatimonadota bacterium]|jgi:acetyl esterase/lipase|nr:alpha/beta hydrolase [Gemmatimonadota bacterium]